MFNYSMWFYLIWQQPLYCPVLSHRHTCNKQHTREAVNARHRVYLPRTVQAAAPPRNKLLMLTGTDRFLPPREGARNCSGVRLPWNAHPQFKPALKKTISPTQLWPQEHKEVTVVHFSVSTSRTVTPQLKI